MPYTSKTDVGKTRKNNEDSLLVRPPRLFAIADGMGGYAAGEVASQRALQVLQAELPRVLEKEAEPDLLPVQLRIALAHINSAVYELAHQDQQYKGMGTTLTGCLLVGSRAYVFNIGDSRVYLLHHGHLKRITRDHSLVGDLLAQGKITEEEAFDHPKKHLLMKGIGVEETVEGDVFMVPLVRDDTLLLCSDGLTDHLRDPELEQMLLRRGLGSVENLPENLLAACVEHCADDLLNAALERGGSDNISLILVNLMDNEEVNRHDR